MHCKAQWVPATTDSSYSKKIHLLDKVSSEKVATGRASGIKFVCQLPAGNGCDAGTLLLATWHYLLIALLRNISFLSGEVEDNFWRTILAMLALKSVLVCFKPTRWIDPIVNDDEMHYICLYTTLHNTFSSVLNLHLFLWRGWQPFHEYTDIYECMSSVVLHL